MQPATLPRFLIPRLSWASTTPSHAFRPAFSAISSQTQAQQSIRLGREKSRSRYYTTQRHTTPAISPISRCTTPASRVQLPLQFSQESCRSFTTTPVPQRDHHFDTLKFVQRLRAEGFSEEQSQALLRVLSDIVQESVQNLTRTMVSREDALKTSYTQKVDFSALRTELLSLDNSESALTRASYERLSNELQKLNNRLRDEVQRTQASVRLDLNLEKGRIREETNSQELKLKETETRIEQEVAGLRERVEGVKFSTLQWLMGVITGICAIMLGAWRLLM